VSSGGYASVGRAPSLVAEAEGYSPEGYTLHAYAAVQVFTEAAERTGSTELGAVVRALHERTYNTVLGPIAFDDKGDVKDFR
jgi:branched-chain amino acid transport system substrate-binding protein